MNLFRVNKHPRVLKTLKALAPEDWRVVVTESAQRMNGVTTTLLSKRLERIVKSLVKLDQKTWRDVVAVSAWPAGYAKQWGTHGRGARDQRMFLSGVERYTLCDSLTDAELQDAALYAETFDQGKAHDTTQCDRALHFLALARGNKKVAAKLMGVARSTYYGYLNACPPELSVAGGRGARGSERSKQERLAETIRQTVLDVDPSARVTVRPSWKGRVGHSTYIAVSQGELSGEIRLSDHSVGPRRQGDYFMHMNSGKSLDLPELRRRIRARVDFNSPESRAAREEARWRQQEQDRAFARESFRERYRQTYRRPNGKLRSAPSEALRREARDYAKRSRLSSRERKEIEREIEEETTKTDTVQVSMRNGRGAFIQPSDVPVRKALDIAAIINTNGTGTHEVWERMDAWVAAQGLRAVLDTVKRIYASNGSKWSTGEENWWISQLVDKS